MLELPIIEPPGIGNQTSLDHFACEAPVRRSDIDDLVAPRLSQRRLATAATQGDDYDRVWDRLGEPCEGVSPFWICFDIVDENAKRSKCCGCLYRVMEPLCKRRRTRGHAAALMAELGQHGFEGANPVAKSAGCESADEFDAALQFN